MKTYMGFACVV